MIRFDTFKKILSSKVALKPLPNGLIHNLKQDFRAWSASLSMKTQAEQGHELEKLLSELVVFEVSDAERIKLLLSIYPNIERLVGQLHQHYIYEVSVITTAQQTYFNQVKSIYYLSILVCRGVVDRQLATPSDTQAKTLLNLPLKKSTGYSNELMLAIYNACDLYLNLLMEQAIAYQKVPSLYWGELNYLYKIAFIRGFYDNTVHKLLSVKKPTTIQDVYGKACLHSLLGLSSYRRQDIIGVHKLLPAWATHVRLTEEVNRDFRLFVDLNGVSPPMHLTPHTKINPYESDRLCLFLDLSEFEVYINKVLQKGTDTAKTNISNGSILNNSIIKANILSSSKLKSPLSKVSSPKNVPVKADKPPNATQLRLAKMAWHTLNTKSERHEHRNIAYDTATVVSSFNVIHYHMANKKPLSRLINHYALQKAHLPKYDTLPKKGYHKSNINVEVMDTSTMGCRFKWKVKPEEEDEPMEGGNLQVLSLFAIQMHTTGKSTAGKIQEGHWRIGIIRWIENHEDVIEAGARIIGYSALACGLRLENKDNRSQDFVPALLLSGDEKLGSKTTLLVPHYHFRLNDKVILRIGQKQTLLRLQQLLVSSDDFEQYDIVQIA